MRVLLCNNFHYYRGGDCTYLFALAELLRSKGHEVIFFSMKHPRNLPSEQEGYFIDGIDYGELHARQTLIAAGTVLRRSIYNVQARANVRRLLRELKPDLAHLQNIHAYLTPSIIPELRRAGVPVVWTLHDYRLLCPESSFLSGGICEECRGGRFYRCTVKRCKRGSRAASLLGSLEAYTHRLFGLCRDVQRFISPSRFLKEKFEEFGWPDSRIVFLRNFLSTMPEPAYGGKGYGVYTGILQSKKGLFTLLDALRRNPDLTFQVIGEGPLRKPLESRARELGLRNVEFRGHLAREELQRALDGASFGVLPSEWYENCPYTIMELMATGKPVIAAALGGMKELVRDGENGLLFRPGDGADLAGKLQQLVNDPERARGMGRIGRQRAENEFGAEGYYEGLERVYDDAVRAG